MTQEDKNLLLKDLCARLPYQVKGIHRGQVHIISNMDGNSLYPSIKVDGYDAWFPVETFKPYLRPLSSMTNEEYREFRKDSNFEAREAYEVRANGEDKIVILQADCDLSVKELDWLNAHHFDYRGLIPMGLALEASDDMYEAE